MTSFILKTGFGLLGGLMLTSCGMQSELVSSTARMFRMNENLPAPPSQQVIAASAGHPTDKHGMATYSDNERTRYVRTTSYSHMEMEPGAPGRKNAAGTTLKYGDKVRSAAADWSVYPLGTKFRIKGDPHLYVVDDYGSSLVGTNTVDIFHPTLWQMQHWGTRKVELTVVQWGCYERSLRLLSGRTGYSHCRSMFATINYKLSTGNCAKLEADPSKLF